MILEGGRDGSWVGGGGGGSGVAAPHPDRATHSQKVRSPGGPRGGAARRLAGDAPSGRRDDALRRGLPSSTAPPPGTRPRFRFFPRRGVRGSGYCCAWGDTSELGGHQRRAAPTAAPHGPDRPVPERRRPSRTSRPRARPPCAGGGSRGGSRGRSHRTAAGSRRRPRAGTPGTSARVEGLRTVLPRPPRFPPCRQRALTTLLTDFSHAMERSSWWMHSDT